MDAMQTLDKISNRVLEIVKENEALKSYITMMDIVISLEEDDKITLQKLKDVVGFAHDYIVRGEKKDVDNTV